MKKVLYIVILVAAALCIFHECENAEWGGSTVANAKDISGPYSIERQWRVFRSDNLLIQAEMYFPDNTSQTMSIAVYRICEFWDDCDAQILINDIDVTDKVCDVGTDTSKDLPLPKDIVLNQLKLIERFYGYEGDLDSAPPAIRSFIKLVAYKRLCYAYDGMETEDRFAPSDDGDSEISDEEASSEDLAEEVTKETAPIPVTTVVSEIVHETPVTVTTTPAEVTAATSEVIPASNSGGVLPLTTTTSEGEVVKTVP